MELSTIAAVSTAYGESGIGVVRLSGPEALSIAERIFQPGAGREKESPAAGAQPRSMASENEQNLVLTKKPRYMHYGHIVDPKSGEQLDEVLCVYMKAPHSYTGEDVVEIQCHGSAVSIKNILALCLRQGASAAERGEFTKRAFLNGRLDLSQAEAVIDLIRARADRSYKAAYSQLEGILSRRIRKIRSALLELLVSLTVNMDYPDEDIEEITYKRLLHDISSINDEILKLLERSGEGRILRDGLAVAIVGRPNVGKSSLMNLFLAQDRSIVTAVPGTTRDTIEESAVLRGIPLRFIDTAGIRRTGDSVESIGVERSKEALARADLLLVVLDASQALSEEDREVISLAAEQPCITVLNKQDLDPVLTREEIEALLPGCRCVEISASQGFGMTALEDVIEDFISSGGVRREEDLLVTNVRHEALLRRASEELAEAASMTERAEALDFIEVNCRAAFDLLGAITGETAGDEVIEEIFSRFCLGK